MLIPGPCGSIDSVFHRAESDQSPVILLIPPHPEKEGNMSCSALKNFFMFFANMGFSVMSFNYRGIGYSSGSFSEGQGEISDAAACIDWVRQKMGGDAPFWVMGYSFGSYVSFQVLMRRPEISHFIAVDLDTRKDFSFLAPCPVSGLFLQSHKMSMHCAHSTTTLISALSFQNASNTFLLENVESPDAFSDCFFQKARTVIQDYVASLNDPGPDVMVPAA